MPTLRHTTRLFIALLVALAVATAWAWARHPYRIEALPHERLDERIDLNAADEAELALLPGIGPALAARIIERRERDGPFARVDELTRVAGVGEKTVEKLRPWVRCDERPEAADRPSIHAASPSAGTAGLSP